MVTQKGTPALIQGLKDTDSSGVWEPLLRGIRGKEELEKTGTILKLVGYTVNA